MTDHVKIYGVRPRIQYTADGTLTTFEFPFAIFSTSDVDVYLDDILQESTAYSVSGAHQSDGGSVTFGTAPTSGTVVTIVRNLSIERITDFQEGGALRANTLNDELDYQIACQQQIAENLNRSMVLPPYATDSNLDLTLPTPSAGKAIVWNSDGTNLENSAVAVNDLESTLNGYKTAAQTAATTATNKADAATTQAQTATTQAGIATTQAGIATTKASEVASALSTKANTAMDNLTNAGKKVITGLCVPDYSSAVGINIATDSTITFTAPYDCAVMIGCVNSSATSTGIIVSKSNGNVIIRNDSASVGTKFMNCNFLLGKSDTVNIQISGINQYSTYCPLKGANL